MEKESNGVQEETQESNAPVSPGQIELDNGNKDQNRDIVSEKTAACDKSVNRELENESDKENENVQHQTDLKIDNSSPEDYVALDNVKSTSSTKLEENLAIELHESDQQILESSVLGQTVLSHDSDRQSTEQTFKKTPDISGNSDSNKCEEMQEVCDAQINLVSESKDFIQMEENEYEACQQDKVCDDDIDHEDLMKDEEVQDTEIVDLKRDFESQSEEICKSTNEQAIENASEAADEAIEVTDECTENNKSNETKEVSFILEKDLQEQKEVDEHLESQQCLEKSEFVGDYLNSSEVTEGTIYKEEKAPCHDSATVSEKEGMDIHIEEIKETENEKINASTINEDVEKGTNDIAMETNLIKEENFTEHKESVNVVEKVEIVSESTDSQNTFSETEGSYKICSSEGKEDTGSCETKEMLRENAKVDSSIVDFECNEERKNTCDQRANDYNTVPVESGSAINTQNLGNEESVGEFKHENDCETNLASNGQNGDVDKDATILKIDTDLDRENSEEIIASAPVSPSAKEQVQTESLENLSTLGTTEVKSVVGPSEKNESCQILNISNITEQKVQDVCSHVNHHDQETQNLKDNIEIQCSENSASKLQNTVELFGDTTSEEMVNENYGQTETVNDILEDKSSFVECSNEVVGHEKNSKLAVDLNSSQSTVGECQNKEDSRYHSSCDETTSLVDSQDLKLKLEDDHSDEVLTESSLPETGVVFDHDSDEALTDGSLPEMGEVCESNGTGVLTSQGTASEIDVNNDVNSEEMLTDSNVDQDLCSHDTTQTNVEYDNLEVKNLEENLKSDGLDDTFSMEPENLEDSAIKTNVTESADCKPLCASSPSRTADTVRAKRTVSEVDFCRTDSPVNNSPDTAATNSCKEGTSQTTGDSSSRKRKRDSENSADEERARKFMHLLQEFLKTETFAINFEKVFQDYKNDSRGRILKKHLTKYFSNQYDVPQEDMQMVWTFDFNDKNTTCDARESIVSTEGSQDTVTETVTVISVKHKELNVSNLGVEKDIENVTDQKDVELKYSNSSVEDHVIITESSEKSIDGSVELNDIAMEELNKDQEKLEMSSHESFCLHLESSEECFSSQEKSVSKMNTTCTTEVNEKIVSLVAQSDVDIKSDTNEEETVLSPNKNEEVKPKESELLCSENPGDENSKNASEAISDPVFKSDTCDLSAEESNSILSCIASEVCTLSKELDAAVVERIATDMETNDECEENDENTKSEESDEEKEKEVNKLIIKNNESSETLDNFYQQNVLTGMKDNNCLTTDTSLTPENYGNEMHNTDKDKFVTVTKDNENKETGSTSHESTLTDKNMDLEDQNEVNPDIQSKSESSAESKQKAEFDNSQLLQENDDRYYCNNEEQLDENEIENCYSSTGDIQSISANFMRSSSPEFVESPVTRKIYVDNCTESQNYVGSISLNKECDEVIANTTGYSSEGSCSPEIPSLHKYISVPGNKQEFKLPLDNESKDERNDEDQLSQEIPLCNVRSKRSDVINSEKSMFDNDAELEFEPPELDLGVLESQEIDEQYANEVNSNIKKPEHVATAVPETIGNINDHKKDNKTLDETAKISNKEKLTLPNEMSPRSDSEKNVAMSNETEDTSHSVAKEITEKSDSAMDANSKKSESEHHKAQNLNDSDILEIPQNLDNNEDVSGSTHNLDEAQSETVAEVDKNAINEMLQQTQDSKKDEDITVIDITENQNNITETLQNSDIEQVTVCDTAQNLNHGTKILQNEIQCNIDIELVATTEEWNKNQNSSENKKNSSCEMQQNSESDERVLAENLDRESVTGDESEQNCDKEPPAACEVIHSSDEHICIETLQSQHKQDDRDIKYSDGEEVTIINEISGNSNNMCADQPSSECLETNSIPDIFNEELNSEQTNSVVSISSDTSSGNQKEADKVVLDTNTSSEIKDDSCDVEEYVLYEDECSNALNDLDEKEMSNSQYFASTQQFGEIIQAEDEESTNTSDSSGTLKADSYEDVDCFAETQPAVENLMSESNDGSDKGYSRKRKLSDSSELSGVVPIVSDGDEECVVRQVNDSSEFSGVVAVPLVSDGEEECMVRQQLSGSCELSGAVPAVSEGEEPAGDIIIESQSPEFNLSNTTEIAYLPTKRRCIEQKANSDTEKTEVENTGTLSDAHETKASAEQSKNCCHFLYCAQTGCNFCRTLSKNCKFNSNLSLFFFTYNLKVLFLKRYL